MAEDDVVPEPAGRARSRRFGAAGSRRPWLIVAIAVAVLVVVVVVGGGGQPGRVVVQDADRHARTRRRGRRQPVHRFGRGREAPRCSRRKSARSSRSCGASCRRASRRKRSSRPVPRRACTAAMVPSARPAIAGADRRTSEEPRQRHRRGRRPSGVRAANISTFVTALTPVVLTMDTRVTNNSYDNATVAPRQSILQAGTAVLVDTTGMPRVVVRQRQPARRDAPDRDHQDEGRRVVGLRPESRHDDHARRRGETRSRCSTRRPASTTSSPSATRRRSAATGQWVRAQPNFDGTRLQSTTILDDQPGQPWTEYRSHPG